MFYSMDEAPGSVTRLLVEPSNGNEGALAELMPLVYSELRRLASYHLQRERGDHTLQASALVHEAYLRLVEQKDADWKNREDSSCMRSTGGPAGNSSRLTRICRKRP